MFKKVFSFFALLLNLDWTETFISNKLEAWWKWCVWPRQHCDFLTFFLGCLTLGEISCYATRTRKQASGMVHAASNWGTLSKVRKRFLPTAMQKSWASDDSSHESAISEQDSWSLVKQSYFCKSWPIYRPERSKVRLLSWDTPKFLNLHQNCKVHNFFPKLLSFGVICYSVIEN